MTHKPDTFKPDGGGWTFKQFWKGDSMVWIKTNNRITAISSVVWVNDEHEPEMHWEWLVSFSVVGYTRVSNKDLKWILRDWKMEQFEEDNHESGIARKFWLAVDERFRKPCPCKDEIIKSEGEYEWSEKKD